MFCLIRTRLAFFGKRYVLLEQVAKDWVTSPPTPEERERAMKKVITLHVVIARLRRESQRPPSFGEPE